MMEIVVLWLGCCNIFRLGLMTDGGRIAASDLNKEKKEVVALIQAQ
jgi:hypothetical protein